MRLEVYSIAAVRRAAWQFLSGKAASAFLTFIILLWLVRLLPVAEYGAYVVLIAGTELGFALAGLGLPWLAARYLPDYRLRANGQALVRLCGRLVLWQALAIVLLAVTIALALDVYLRWVNLTAHRAAAWVAVGLLVSEGQGRFLREGLMAPLMLQSEARASLILRQFAFFAAIAVLTIVEKIDLNWVLAAEAVASLFGWLIACIAIARHLRALRGQAALPGWQEPRLEEQWRMALRMHTAHLITLAYGPQIFLNLIQRVLGAEAAALFGFLRTLYEQVARYLPATLLFAVLRPKLMTSHLKDGMVAIASHANLAGKMSHFVLLPLVVIVSLGGDLLVSLLSGSKFENGGSFLLGLLVALIPYSQRQLIETIAVAAGRSGLCTLGSILGLLALPLMLYLLDLGLGLWAPVAAVVFGQIVFNATLIIGLKRSGYRPDWLGTTKLIASALFAWLLACLFNFIERTEISILLASIFSTLAFLALVWRMRAFTTEERQHIDSVLGRRLFAR